MDDTVLSRILAQNKLALSGPFGSGKSKLAIARVQWLLQQERVRGDEITVLIPQRTLAQPYYQALRQPRVPPGPPVRIQTVAGLTQAAVELYWPLVAAQAGFANPQQEPTFLNLETSQYHMAHLVEAAFARGEFDGVRVERVRVVSQVLDNMNKAALYGLSIDEAYQRLLLAVPAGEQRTARIHALQAAQAISHRFRQLCLQATLVDFSLLISLFNRQILTHSWSRTHLFRTCRHLIVDNAEEETFTGHGLVQQWLPHLQSALIVVDSDAGFRLFLGADPQGAAALIQACPERLTVAREELAQGAPARALAELERRIQRATALPGQPTVGGAAGASADALPAHRSVLPALTYQQCRFYPQMVQWAVERIAQLVHTEEVAPGQIAVLAPFLSDALRFSIQRGLQAAEIPSTSHRPSRPLQNEPAARCLLTLAALAHPQWEIRPPASDVSLALSMAIEPLDPVRAQLLTQVVYATHAAAIDLQPFGSLSTPVQQRISYVIGEQYSALRDWLYAYRAEAEPTPPDQFFARLFGELLSQPRFGFHAHSDAGRLANQLVESARNFRWALQELPDGVRGEEVTGRGLGRAYLRLVESGAVGALYLAGWRPNEEAVFVGPAYTFLMRNRSVDIQFWLDAGAGGWWERLYQPLTHPYVLSPRWPAHQAWTDMDEYRARQESLRRLLLGLVRRTRRGIYLGLSDYGESGQEQRGPLLTLVNRILAQERLAGGQASPPEQPETQRQVDI